MSTTTVPKRQLGKNGPEVSAIGFGAMGLSVAYGPGGTDEERMKVLDETVRLGSTYIDSANVYGDNEDLLGKWFKQNPGMREKVFLATKFGLIFKDNKMSVRGDPEYVKECLNKSIERLGTTPDLYYYHRVDQSVPIEDVMDVLVEAIKEKKIKYIGLSECSTETLRRAHAVHPITAIQIEYSPFALDAEEEFSNSTMLDTARELGVAIVAYSPLGRGLLTGTIKSPDDFDADDFRRTLPRFNKENFPKNLQIVDKIKEIAEKKNATPGQVTIAWILAQGPDFFPIPGTRKVKYLRENVDSINIKLTKEEVQEIREAVEKIDLKGDRYGDTSHLRGDTPKRK